MIEPIHSFEGGELDGFERPLRATPMDDLGLEGFRQFLLRGLDQVRGEWALICTAHNLLKLAKAGH